MALPQFEGFDTTQHFWEQMRSRRIPEALVAWCLYKGKVIRRKMNESKIRVGRNELQDAVSQGYLNREELVAVTEFILIINQGRLITCFLNFGDTGL